MIVAVPTADGLKFTEQLELVGMPGIGLRVHMPELRLPEEPEGVNRMLPVG